MQVLSGWFWGPHPSVAKLGSQSFHVKWSHQPPAFLGLSSAQVSAIVQHLGTPINAIYIKPHLASRQIKCPERLHFNSSISWHGNLLYGAYDLRPYNTVHQNRFGP